MKLLAAGSVLALALAAGAQQSSAAQATMPAWREVVIYAADASYPPELARRGVQGEATIELSLPEGGRERVATVRESSRSAELDALAMALVKRMEIAGARDAPSGLVQVQFRKDHATTLAAKSCADFNVDAAYQAATFPERSVRELPVMNEGVGMLIYSLHRAGTRKSFPAMESVMDATVAACARTPDAGMLDVMRQEALKLIGN